MPRFSPGVVILLFAAAIVFATCDAPLSTDLLSPDGSLQEIVDGRDIDSNVYLLPPIGQSYTAEDFDEFAITRVEVCPLVEDRVDLESYDTPDWDALEEPDKCIADGTVVYQEEIELVTDDFGNPLHYQLNLKTDAEDYNKAFRVTVSTLAGSPLEGVAWKPKAWFGLALFENSSAINVPDDWVGETAGQNFPVKYVVEYQKSDSFAVEVDCEGGTFVGNTAGISFTDDAFSGCSPDNNVILVLVQEKADLDTDLNEVCLPVGWDQDGPCYRWQLYTFDGITYEVYDGEINENSLTVAYCLEDDLENRELWSGFKTPADYDTYVAPTTNTKADFEGSIQTACPVPPEGMVGLLYRARQFLGLAPRLLYAAHGGFGELVGGNRLSRFGRALAQTLSEGGGDGQSGLINSTLGEPLVVRAMTIPHEVAGESPDPAEPVPGQEVKFEVTAGNGLLAKEFNPVTGTCDGEPQPGSIKVDTDELGYARVCWTMGPNELEDQTVEASGSNFGQLDGPDADGNFVFVADQILFSATAYNVVTDFLEPLDEKDGYSGDPITGIVPGVVICASAEGEADCDAFSQQFDETEIKLTDDGGRWFFQVNWKPRDFGAPEGVYVVHVVLDGGIVVGESVEIVVDKGGKVELVDGQLQINPTTDLPIKFTLSRPL